MKPVYEVGDIIVVKKTAASQLKVGDDVTYRGSTGAFDNLVVTHRIIRERQENGKYYFTTQGVANTGEDPEINEDNIFGKVICHTFLFSFVGRLMNNVIIYYVLFVSVGVAFSYEIISSFFMNGDEKDDE